MSSWHATAAAAFDAAAVPLAGSRSAVARVLGISRSAYGDTVRGRWDGTQAARQWADRWAEARPEERIMLHYDPERGWRAVVVTGLEVRDVEGGTAQTTKTAPPRRTGEGQREER